MLLLRLLLARVEKVWSKTRSLFHPRAHYPSPLDCCWQNKHFARRFNQTQRGIEIRPARSGIKIIQIDDPACALCLHSANIDAVVLSLAFLHAVNADAQKMF